MTLTEQRYLERWAKGRERGTEFEFKNGKELEKLCVFIDDGSTFRPPFRDVKLNHTVYEFFNTHLCRVDFDRNFYTPSLKVSFCWDRDAIEFKLRFL